MGDDGHIDPGTCRVLIRPTATEVISCPIEVMKGPAGGTEVMGATQMCERLKAHGRELATIVADGYSALHRAFRCASPGVDVICYRVHQLRAVDEQFCKDDSAGLETSMPDSQHICLRKLSASIGSNI